MKKRTILAAVLALALLACAGGGRAYAYFTTYSDALGSKTLQLGDHTEIHEEFGSWLKTVTISSEAGSQPMYVRARAFGSTVYPLSYEFDDEYWIEQDDGWVYYRQVLNGGESTPGEENHALNVRINNVPASEALKAGDHFNVAVVYEWAPVVYDGQGEPNMAASWAAELDRAEGGGD